MAANNIGVPKRIPAPNTIERVGIGNGGSDPSAPKPKQASPAFTFGGAGSGTAFQHGSEDLEKFWGGVVQAEPEIPFLWKVVVLLSRT